MASTPLTSLIGQARIHLKETTANFWADSELLDHMRNAVRDLWGAVVDLHQDHFTAIDVTNVQLNAGDDHLSGVPQDCFRVLGIEPRDTTSAGATQDVLFYPKKYFDDDMRNSRQLTTQDPTVGLAVFYNPMGLGSPNGDITIKIAPPISSVVLCRFMYVQGPNAAAMALTPVSTYNPIPGESDNALIAWVVAYARAKEREDRTPDPNWLMIYATEKQNLLVRLAPRQEQEPDSVEDLFAGFL